MGFVKWTIEDVLGETIRSKKCLRWVVNEESVEYWKLYAHYDNGYLLYAGGVYDQPAKYLEAMGIIEARITKIRNQQLERDKK